MPPQALTPIALVVILVAIGLIWVALFLPGRHQGVVMFTALCLFVAAQFLMPTRDRARARSARITWTVVLAVFGVGATAYTLRQRHITHAFKDWAVTHGFAVASESRSSAQETLPETLRQLLLLRRSEGAETYFVLEQADPIHDFRTTIFGLWTRQFFFRSSAMRYAPYTLTVFAFRRPAIHWPAFELRPARVAAEQPGGELGWPDVDLASEPRFAKHYSLRAAYADNVASLLSDEVATALRQEPGWCLEALGEWCIAYRFHQAKTFWTFRPSRFEYCTNPEQLAARLDTARRLFGLVAARLA